MDWFERLLLVIVTIGLIAFMLIWTYAMTAQTLSLQKQITGIFNAQKQIVNVINQQARDMNELRETGKKK